MPLLGSRIDDEGCILVGDHTRAEGAGAVDDGHQVDPEHILPVCLGPEEGAARLDAGIVHQHMHASEPLDDGALQRFQFIQLRDVRADRNDIGFSAGCESRDFNGRSGQLVAFEVNQNDAETHASKCLGGCEADARGGAGDDGDMTFHECWMWGHHGQIPSTSMTLAVMAIWYPCSASST